MMSNAGLSYARLRRGRTRMAGGLTWGGWILALALVWGLLPYQPVAAALPAQAEAQTLGLGEYGLATAEVGDTFTYAVEIPESGNYLITAVDEDAAAAFDLVVTAADGTVLYDDIFASAELALDPGTLTLTFLAAEPGDLFFVVAGEIGVMTPDATAPGRLYAGGAYAEEQVSDARYAILDVPPTTSPRRVIVYVEPGEGDAFYAAVEGDDIGFADLDTDSGNLLSFWSTGGEYLVTVDPFERRSAFSLAVFISPPPAQVLPGSETDGVIAAGTEDVVFEVVLDRPYNLLSVDLLDDAEGLEIDFVDDLYNPTYSGYSFGEPFVDLENVPPGSYYVRIYGETQAADRPVAIAVDGEAGQPIQTLTLDEAATGILDEETTSVTYQVEIPQAGALVAVAIASDTEDNDFDIEAGLRVGEPIWYSFALGSDDLITFVAPVAGTYYVTLVSNDTVGDYALAVSLGDLAPAVPVDGTPLLDTIEASGANLYRMEISEPGNLISLILVGPSEGDLDLELRGYDLNGQETMLEYGISSGAVEVVSGVAQEPGILAIEVNSYHSEDANFALIARVEDPDRILRQWAAEAAASSEFGELEYAAIQATGAPDTNAGDNPTAWAALEPDAGEEYLEVAYEFAVVPGEINIHQTYNPGAIYAVEIYDLANEQWVSVWEGEPGPVESEAAVFSIELSDVDFSTDGVRILLDTTSVPGWNEIDAVELRGRP